MFFEKKLGNVLLAELVYLNERDFNRFHMSKYFFFDELQYDNAIKNIIDTLKYVKDQK